jgi:hypothetical protein
MAKQITFDNIDFVHASFSNTQNITGVPFKMNPIAEGIRLESEMKGGGLGAVLGAVVAIAIPFIAPAVAGAVFGSSVMAGAISGTLASAATGAVLGGINASLTGGDWQSGALAGGLGGGLTQGIGGFGSTNNPLFGQATTANAGFFGPTGTVTQAGQGQAGWFGNQPPVDLSTSSTGNAASAMSSSSTTPATASDALSSSTTPAQPVAGANQPVVGANGQPVLGANGQPLTAPAPQSAWQNLTSRFSAGEAPAQFVKDTAGNNIVNPAYEKWVTAANMSKDRLVNASISAGVPALTNAISTYMTENAADKRMQQYQKELDTLKATDQKAYEAKLAEVQNYIQNARNMNPAYFGQQSANLANTQGTRRLAESFREMPMAGLRNAGYSSGERRRADLALSQNVGTAYDRGYGTGLNLQNQMLERGVAMYPSASSRSLSLASGMENMYANEQAQADRRAAGLSQTVGNFTNQYLVKV